MHAHQMDAGGGRTRTPVSSDVAVDAGEIKAFAKFLTEMIDEVDALHRRMSDLGATDEDFGIHHSSATAGKAHTAALGTAVSNLEKLTTRAAELADGSHAIARNYADVEDLNSASAAGITGVLTRDGGQ